MDIRTWLGHASLAVTQIYLADPSTDSNMQARLDKAADTIDWFRATHPARPFWVCHCRSLLTMGQGDAEDFGIAAAEARNVIDESAESILSWIVMLTLLESRVGTGCRIFVYRNHGFSRHTI